MLECSKTRNIGGDISDQPIRNEYDLFKQLTEGQCAHGQQCDDEPNPSSFFLQRFVASLLSEQTDVEFTPLALKNFHGELLGGVYCRCDIT